MALFFVNTYRKGTKFPKIVLEELLYLSKNIIYAIKYSDRHRRVLFYPDLPSKRSVIAKLLRNLGYNITNNPGEKYQAAVYWKKVTVRKAFSQYAMRESINGKLLNEFCTDISKKFIDTVHCETLGYGLTVNPLTFTGKAVIKSDDNATHDGRIIQCPVDSIQPNYVYQIVVNNQVSEQRVQDIRVPFICGDIPFVYLKYRNINDRFSNGNDSAEMKQVGEIFSDQEVESIIKFCRGVNLDYGELDVLRDRTTNRIYIVDVNYTPWGPPNHLRKEDYQPAIEKLASCFKNRCLG